MGAGINTTVRQEMGQDIAGACGQLVIQAGSQHAAASGALSSEPAPEVQAAAAAGGLRDIEDMVV
eukprot:SAG11_NODE_9571_length_899_cov_2.321250_1_plen_65_part_00